MSKTAIICVDDEEIILRSLKQQLKRSIDRNYEIELALNGWEAFEICAELKAEGIDIALVISDQIMSGMSGDEFLIRFHAAYPETLKILLTGQAEADSVGNIVNAASLYRYIPKPWDETDLILTVKEALRRYGQEKQLVAQNTLLKQTNQLLKNANHKLSKSIDLLLATLEAADDGILVLDNQGEIVVCNQQFFYLWEINPKLAEPKTNDILNAILKQINHPISCDLPAKNKQNISEKYHLIKLNNNKILQSYFQIQHLGNKAVGLVWGFRDVTEIERAKAIAKHQSSYDTLTQLPRRSILNCQLSSAITKARQNFHLVSVMFIDLDRFKIISDTLGYQTSDTLLHKIVKRIKESVRGEDVLARWGRDEFTLLLPQIHNKQAISDIANRIIKTLKAPFEIENKKFYINIYIGIAIYPEHGKDAATILKNADAALSQAQKLNNNIPQYYNSNLNFEAHKLLTLENLLHSALKENQFLLYYQPIVNVTTGKIEKMETLLRWQNPQLGLVSPNIFIPLAEANGQIIPIGEWVLKTACAQNKAWQEMGLSPIRISVNLSVRQFQQPNLISTIISIFEETQLSANNLELEITESITIQDTELAQTILNQLNNLGLSLSMDDFGTGYSSLAYLKHFPFHTLKIDRSLIKDLHPNSEDLAIVNAVITLGKGLNLKVVAEGVETEEIKDLLRNLGCDYIQGYLFSKPLPAAEATKLLEKKNSIVTSRI